MTTPPRRPICATVRTTRFNTGTINSGGYRYAIGASSFSNGVYQLKQTHLAHALSLRSDGGDWEWEGIVTLYDYAQDKQRAPSAALPGGFDGGAGTITRMDGTGWYTAGLRAVWHGDNNDLSFGAHYDRETLKSLKYNTADWKHGSEGALATAARGKTDNRGAVGAGRVALRPGLEGDARPAL